MIIYPSILTIDAWKIALWFSSLDMNKEHDKEKCYSQTIF